MSKKKYQICTRCVMDSTDPLIIFDSNGLCNHCTEFLNKRINHQYRGSESDAAFENLIQNIKSAGKGKQYDCVLGLSGGVDSSYAAYILKEQRVRVLAVHLDNGWNSKEAVSNINNVAKKLGIDCESFIPNYVEFKEVQLAFLKASIPEAETPTDMAIQAAVHKVAAKHSITYIISGGNFATEGILPASWHYNAKDTRYFKYITRKFSNTKIQKFPNFGYKEEFFYKLIKGIKIIYILNYVQFKKEDAQKLLEQKLNWSYYGGKHRESIYTEFIQSYYLFEKFNIDYRRATLSTQICTGEVARSDALSELVVKPYEDKRVKEIKQIISKELGITEEDLNRILSSTPKWYWEYPNDYKKLAFIYNSYRRIYKREKLGSF